MIDDLWQYRARPHQAVDGDTIKVIIDHGMQIQSKQSLRLLALDTAEVFSGTNRIEGMAARDFVAGWLAEHTHDEEWPLRVRTVKDRRSFNRYLAAVECCEGHDLVTAIRLAGHGE